MRRYGGLSWQGKSARCLRNFVAVNVATSVALLMVSASFSVPARQATRKDTERIEARRSLLEAIAPLDRGFSATREQRSQVSEKLSALVRLNPEPDPTSKIGGEWTLIYTDAPDIIGIPTGPLSSLGRIGQEIDASAGTIANVIEYRPSQLASNAVVAAQEDALVQRVFTDFSVSSPTTVDLKIRGLGFLPRKVLGFELPEALQLSLKGPLSLPFGRFEILYLDEEVRIIRTGQGWLSVNRRGA
mmetsp:Transcript_97808/g.174230  ORF Transcript_97808/g.174230 Transcript_97808/m.174230 type:complete len:244 (+) Transcript_97808:44-775(+)